MARHAYDANNAPITVNNKTKTDTGKGNRGYMVHVPNVTNSGRSSLNQNKKYVGKA